MAQIQRITCGNVNCYLISNENNAILVDTGRENHRQKILTFCKGYQVRLLVLTHGHVDHVQNAAYLSQALECPIAMHRADIPLLADNMRQPLSANNLLGKIVLSASVKSFQTDVIPAFTPTIFLNDGDSLDSYGISASVLSLPGHTDGSIGLDIAGHDLIVGDALMNMFYPTISMLYHDWQGVVQSVQRIQALGPRTIYFGHGKPVSNRIWIK